jgi:hypothetical protein
VTDGRPKAPPAQEKSLRRIQLTGVLALIFIVVTMRVLARSDVIDVWKLLVLGFAAMIALMMVAGLAVSRVEERPFGEVMRDSLRASSAEIRSAPARLRSRVVDALPRRRPR